MTSSTAITKAGGGFAIAPANMGELYKFAELLAGSDLVPKAYQDKPGNVMVAIQMGGELGLSPMQSIQNIAVIGGRPSLWGDALLAVCLPYLDELEETDDGHTATCKAKRGNRTVTETFSMDDAKQAGLISKDGPWKQYPKRMRKMRARGFCLRDICADVLRGIHSAEEAEDMPPREVRAEVVEQKPVDEPKPKEERKSDPPPPAASKPVGPVFALTWPDKKWAGKLLSEAPGEALTDYAAWCQGIVDDASRQRLHKKAQASLDEVAAEIDQRIEAEAAKAAAEESAGDVARKAEDIADQNEGWGLASP